MSGSHTLKKRCQKNYVRVGPDCVLKSDVAERKNATKAAKAMKMQTKQKRCPRGTKRYPPNGGECLTNSARGRAMSARRSERKARPKRGKKLSDEEIERILSDFYDLSEEYKKKARKVMKRITFDPEYVSFFSGKKNDNPNLYSQVSDRVAGWLKGGDSPHI